MSRNTNYPHLSRYPVAHLSSSTTDRIRVRVHNGIKSRPVLAHSKTIRFGYATRFFTTSIRRECFFFFLRRFLRLLCLYLVTRLFGRQEREYNVILRKLRAPFLLCAIFVTSLHINPSRSLIAHRDIENSTHDIASNILV